VFDYRDGDVYWCTADIGWVTGHSYIVYGPLANGAVTLMFEGMPTYPDASRFWQVIDKHQVNIFYTAPTALRALMGEGDAFVKRCDRGSLRILGSVGEPINPGGWEWYYNNVGDARCPIVDTWWQTETGGILITPLPGARALKPGSATLPFFGVEPALLDDRGPRSWKAPLIGNLVITHVRGRGSCARCTATTSGSSTPTSPCTRACTSPATAPGAMRTVTGGSPAGWTT
jgi:acetyl-CoA synthetase